MTTSHPQPQRSDVETSAAQEIQQEESANNILFKTRKVFNDPIHGQIEIHPVCVRIIDTPQFQRLRNIKQLDTCYLVYPGASHNRFEHSLGVCHLAGKLLRTIKERQPREEITNRDILCVEIAGLCHDLGQGPFSHVFEKRFMPRMKKEFTHEGTAKKMFEYMLESNGGKVKDDIQTILGNCKMQDFSAFEENDFTFIKEMIDKPKNIETRDWPYEGRDESKSFMYEIVRNKRNGVDVDKWDYLARDSYMLGINVNFDHNRCFASARVLKVNGMNGGNGVNEGNGPEGTPHASGVNGETRNEGNLTVYRKQICYRDNDALDLYDMFYTRMTLHRRAYQHKTHNLIGMMICDALEKVDDALKISDKVNDMEAYTRLTDDVIQRILYPFDSEGTQANKPGIEEARNILRDILSRNLYKCICQLPIKGCKLTAANFKSEFDEVQRDEEFSVQAECIDWDIVTLDYGMEDTNPLKKVRFYEKDKLDSAVELPKNKVSFLLPDTFSEQIVRVYYKKSHPDKNELEKVKKAFKKWCEKQQEQVESDETQQNTAVTDSGQRRDPEDL